MIKIFALDVVMRQLAAEVAEAEFRSMRAVLQKWASNPCDPDHANSIDRIMPLILVRYRQAMRSTVPSARGLWKRRFPWLER